VVRSETRPGAANADRERRAATVKTRRRDRSGETSGLDDASRWGEAGLLREKLRPPNKSPACVARSPSIFLDIPVHFACISGALSLYRSHPAPSRSSVAQDG
jgi:hypothetical protein